MNEISVSSEAGEPFSGHYKQNCVKSETYKLHLLTAILVHIKERLKYMGIINLVKLNPSKTFFFFTNTDFVKTVDFIGYSTLTVLEKNEMSLTTVLPFIL